MITMFIRGCFSTYQRYIVYALYISFFIYSYTPLFLHPLRLNWLRQSMPPVIKYRYLTILHTKSDVARVSFELGTLSVENMIVSVTHHFNNLHVPDSRQDAFKLMLLGTWYSKFVFLLNIRRLNLSRYNLSDPSSFHHARVTTACVFALPGFDVQIW